MHTVGEEDPRQPAHVAAAGQAHGDHAPVAVGGDHDALGQSQAALELHTGHTLFVTSNPSPCPCDGCSFDLCHDPCHGETSSCLMSRLTALSCSLSLQSLQCLHVLQ